jgi:WD40 repeat protein
VASADFSRTGDWLATAGEDRVVKLWDWRSRRVVMDVSSKRGGFYEEGYGVARKVAGLGGTRVTSPQVSKDGPVFTEGVTKAKFFYMDSLLLSSSGNK